MNILEEAHRLHARIKEKARERSLIRKTERQRWTQIMARCYKPQHKAYKNYGGRGIRVFPAWHDFDKYFEDVGPCPSPELSLDRIDNDGDYEPGNVRWATDREQAQNSRLRSDSKGYSVIKIGGRWRALIRVSAAKTFSSAEEAEAWAAGHAEQFRQRAV